MSHNRALQPAADAVAIRAHGERAAPRGPGASNGSRAPPRLSAPAASDRYRCPPPSLRGKVQSRARASCQSPDGVLICAGACECGRGSGVARRGASTRAAETSDASSLTPRARARTAASSSIHADSTARYARARAAAGAGGASARTGVGGTVSRTEPSPCARAAGLLLLSPSTRGPARGGIEEWRGILRRAKHPPGAVVVATQRRRRRACMRAVLTAANAISPDARSSRRGPRARRREFAEEGVSPGVSA